MTQTVPSVNMLLFERVESHIRKWVQSSAKSPLVETATHLASAFVYELMAEGIEYFCGLISKWQMLTSNVELEVTLDESAFSWLGEASSLQPDLESVNRIWSGWASIAQIMHLLIEHHPQNTMSDM